MVDMISLPSSTSFSSPASVLSPEVEASAEASAEEALLLEALVEAPAEEEALPLEAVLPQPVSSTAHMPTASSRESSFFISISPICRFFGLSSDLLDYTLYAFKMQALLPLLPPRRSIFVQLGQLRRD